VLALSLPSRSAISLTRLERRLLATHLDLQSIKYLSAARFSIAGRFATIEERGLIGKDQPRSSTLGKQFYSAQCGRDTRLAIVSLLLIIEGADRSNQ
jgi:hypothetical protein